jgi:hypothetical protein
MTRKVQLRRFDLGRSFMCTILPLRDHDDFVSGKCALAQNLPSSGAEGEIDQGGKRRGAEARYCAYIRPDLYPGEP